MNKLYVDLLPEARRLEEHLDTDWAYDHESEYDAFFEKIEAAYYSGELSAVEYNSLADIAFFELPDGFKEVDDDKEDYSNLDYAAHGLEEPSGHFHRGSCARKLFHLL